MFAKTAFFEKTYREALSLLREARDYLAYCEECNLKPNEPFERLRFSAESARLTARLTTIMAWLFLQKAVVTGELTAEKVREDCGHLLRRDGCLARAALEGSPDRKPTRQQEALPPGLMSLLERSRRLYVRVTRLDELIAWGAA